ncbi:hypothetical protein HPB50_024338 [Hyalomma asiaticum]|uniref:Uncharacterized protein n=1 Tax=Hyalomma asiaticum TaxID=266040 RepID=A0ACB7T979_HYAAI|nr:hypothetical protein HPB50_024338 [Hyalomma asiaticum]
MKESQRLDNKRLTIMIGYYIKSQNTHVFRGQKDTSKDVTFRMTFTTFGVWVVTEGERAVLNGEPLNDQWAEIIVQNMKIKDIEIKNVCTTVVELEGKATGFSVEKVRCCDSMRGELLCVIPLVDQRLPSHHLRLEGVLPMVPWHFRMTW